MAKLQIKLTYLDIFDIKITQIIFGEFEPSQFVVDWREAFFVLRTLCHPTTFAHIVQAVR